MKITKEVCWLGLIQKVEEFSSISSAVEDATDSGADLTELVGRLVESIYVVKPRHEAVSYILGPGYQVEEE